MKHVYVLLCLAQVVSALCGLQRRIAEYLATVVDPRERRALLAEALTPPDTANAATGLESSPAAASLARNREPAAGAASMHELVTSLVGTMDADERPQQAHASINGAKEGGGSVGGCLLYTSPSPRDRQKSRMPSSA